MEEATVGDLICQDTGRWSKELIETIFFQSEASKICGIPIRSKTEEDKQIWHYTKQGIYSVKSRYHLAMKLMRESPSSSDNSNIRGDVMQWALEIQQQGHRGKTVEEIALFAFNYYAEYSQVLDRVETPLQDQLVCKWVAPENGVHQIVNMVTVEHREALGALYAIEFAKDLGLTVILEGDFLSRTFPGSKCSHVCIEGNRVAHILVRMAVKSEGFQAWVEEVPDFIAPVVSAEAPDLT
ncbi:hypothetical protein Acr_28g0002330 [Actinidia rufa]|uniref:Uncharacterized protein n=1 Tax=Actinidia rufa TaxID=165716 RepID=A0A7J0H939_9ERIC|nr:hypothetical protein Acr_28g0002330 [Actinidia rufa]